MDVDVERTLTENFIILGIAAFVFWIVIAVFAYILAPDDRRWHFFWCSLFLLGPLAIVLALIAPARPQAPLD